MGETSYPCSHLLNDVVGTGQARELISHSSEVIYTECLETDATSIDNPNYGGCGSERISGFYKCCYLLRKFGP